MIFQLDFTNKHMFSQVGENGVHVLFHCLYRYAILFISIMVYIPEHLYLKEHFLNKVSQIIIIK